jgi:hypothetical protein
MDENKNLVTEQVTENVEQTTEQSPKMYTQAEVDAIVGKRNARTEKKIRREYEDKYNPLLGVLRDGLGKESVEEITADLSDFYYGQKKVKKTERQPQYSERDLEVLAERDAQEFISAGYEDVCDEVDRLAEKGAANMTAREKAMFMKLCEHRQAAERRQELTSLGADEETLNSKEFKEFAAMFDKNTPMQKVYETFRKTQPQKEIRTPGSMKHSAPPDTGVKDFYSYEEAKKFTKADFDKNPALFAAVERSMQKW